MRNEIFKVDRASFRFGFETVLATVGGVVNQDQGLGKIYATLSAGNVSDFPSSIHISWLTMLKFFQERLCAPGDDIILGHLKAHV